MSCKGAKEQKHKSTKTQRHKGVKAQRYKGAKSKAQGIRCKVQGAKCSTKHSEKCITRCSAFAIAWHFNNLMVLEKWHNNSGALWPKYKANENRDHKCCNLAVL